MEFNVVKTDPGSRARVGRIKTEHGFVDTPSYVIVGTHAEVRCLRKGDIEETLTQMVIANTYHLWRGLGDDGLHDYPGLHSEMNWQGTIMTDSGGFQVFSLGFLRDNGLRQGNGGKKPTEPGDVSDPWVRITEAGVYFKPDDSDEEFYLDAETSIKIQEQLGADIIVAFDEPTSPASDHLHTAEAMRRTHNWAERSLEAKESSQALYGVVQGGAFEDLRTQSAKFIGSLPFDGFAIGSTYGDAYGGTKDKTKDMLEWSVPYLPPGKPRHLFGVGRIEDLFSGVEAGIDTFDCVIPTREARHGAIWTASGRFDILKGKHKSDDSPLDETCGCPVCLSEDTTRASLRQFFKDKNPEAGRLATIHNVYFFNNLMSEIRSSIEQGNFRQFKEEYLKKLANSE